MKRYLFFFLFFCFVVIGFSQNTSKVDFVIKNLGINVDGHFNSCSITTKFNETNSQLESISGSITVSSIETGIENRDEHLLEEDYFNSEKHKQIILKSESVTKISATEYSVKANLTIKGITKAININVNVENIDGSNKTSSSFEINRKDFKVGGSSFVMSNTVKINIIYSQKL